MSDSTRASVEAGSSSAPKLRKNDARMRIVSGAVTDWISSWRGDERAGDGERAAVQARSRGRTTSSTTPTADDDVAVTSSWPVAAPIDDADQADDSSCAEAEHADADHLPGQELARADRAQQQLDDAGRLLLDDAGRDPEAVAEQLAVEDHDGDERDPLAVGRARRRPRSDRAAAAGAAAPRAACEPDLHRARRPRRRRPGRRAAPRPPAQHRDVGVPVADEPARGRVVGHRADGELRRRTPAAARGRRGDGGGVRGPTTATVPLRRPAEAERAGQDEDAGEHGDGDAGRDPQRALAAALDDLAAGDERDRRARRRSRAPPRGTARRGSARTGAKRRTRPARRRGVEQRLLVGVLGRARRRPRRRRRGRRRTLGTRARPSPSRAPATSTRQRRAPRRARSSATRPDATTRPAADDRRPRRRGARRARAGGSRRRPARPPARARAAPR